VTQQHDQHVKAWRIKFVFDADARVLTAAYEDAVLAAIPANTSHPPDTFWCEQLTGIIGDHLTLSELQERRPPQQELARWRNIAALMSDLDDHELLRPFKRLVDMHVIGYEMIAHPRFWGKRILTIRCQLLLGRVLDLWLELGCELQFSRGQANRPHGPLIKFIDAVCRPVLGDEMPSVHTIAAFIDRAKEGCYFHPPKIDLK
jgi:hypothetical protein